MPPPFQLIWNFSRDSAPGEPHVLSLDVLAPVRKREGEIYGAEPEPPPVAAVCADLRRLVVVDHSL